MTPQISNMPCFQHSTNFDNSKDNVIFSLHTESSTNLLCLQKQLEAGHSKGMTTPILGVLSDLQWFGSWRSSAPVFTVCLHNSREK